MLGFEGLLLSFVRFASFVFVFPLFSQRGVPPQIKIGFAGLLALVVSVKTPIEFDGSLNWLFVVIQEIGVGIMLAFCVTLVFGIIYFAGQLVDVPMGFGLVSIFDPQTGIQLPIFSQFYNMLGLIIFLAVDGHLWVLRALADSYRYIPINGFFDLNYTMNSLLVMGKQIFTIGLQIAAPIMGTIIFTDIALGIITKAVPQINVFVLGFPIKILVGLLVVLIAIPTFVSVAARLFGYDGLLIEFFMGLVQSGQ